MTQRIQKAIDVFLDAINNGTLAKGTCRACAIGNLVAHGLGAKIEITKNDNEIKVWCDKNNVLWRFAFITSGGKQQIYKGDFDSEIVLYNVNATDFSIRELAAIEFAFETNTKIDFKEYLKHSPAEIRADQIKGLEASVKVMLEFDQQPDDVKQVFTTKAELIPV